MTTMSNQVNDELFDRAMEIAEECTNTMIGAEIELAIAMNDLYKAQELIVEAEQYLRYIETISGSERL